MSTFLRTAVTLAVMTFATGAVAADAYYRVPILDLKLTDGTLPATLEPTVRRWRFRDRARTMRPRAVLDGEGEVYIDLGENPFGRWSSRAPMSPFGTVVIRAPERAL